MGSVTVKGDHGSFLTLNVTPEGLVRVLVNGGSSGSLLAITDVKSKELREAVLKVTGGEAPQEEPVVTPVVDSKPPAEEPEKAEAPAKPKRAPRASRTKNPPMVSNP